MNKKIWFSKTRFCLDKDYFIEYCRQSSIACFWHRKTGPAKIYSNGSHVWILNGRYHRLNGPTNIITNIQNFTIKDEKNIFVLMELNILKINIGIYKI